MSKVLTRSTQNYDQRSTFIKALGRKEAYPHDITEVKLIETHISWVFLTGDYVYKIKKSVNFGFLDFSTLPQRRFYCSEEVRLNQRLSNDLYLNVVPITGTQANPKISGTGKIIEYAVKMRQFPPGQLLNELAIQNTLPQGIIDQLALQIAGFHTIAEQADENSLLSSIDNIKHWFDENFDHIKPLLENSKERQQLNKIKSWGETEWRRIFGVLKLRQLRGFIRECHGDLHLSNITLVNCQLVPFDCIEFNPMLRWIDVLSDIAFLVIDLLFLGLPEQAYQFLNRYLQQTGDYSGILVFRYYLVYRALVLAKVTLLRRKQHADDNQSQQRYDEYKNFAFLAESFTKNQPVFLLILHGFSGSGKTTLANQLGQQLGAIHLRSDIERKRLQGHAELDHSNSGLDSGLYTPEHTSKTYAYLADLAKDVLFAGFPCIVDATFLQREQRESFKVLAEELAVGFLILDMQVPENILLQRIQQRQNDASEATESVLKQQLQSAQALAEEELAYSQAMDTETPDWLEKLKIRINNLVS